MAMMSPQTQRNHAEPPAHQFSVFLANRIGQLKDLLDMLAEQELPMLGFSVVDSTDWAVLRMVFADPPKARKVLREHGLSFTETEVLLTQVETDETLAGVCGALVQAEIKIHFAYPLAIRGQYPVVVLHVDDTILAKQVLTKHGFTLISGNDIPPGDGS
jgi:hypothetical protein